MASGVCSVETAVEGGGDHLRGYPASILLDEEHHGYVLYPLQKVGALGRIHADRWPGVRSLQVPIPPLGPGGFQELPQGAVSAMRALEEMGWLPEFVTGTAWRCAKWATSQAVARPYAGLEELRSFARACDGRAQWTAYGMAVLLFQPPSGVADPAQGASGSTPLSVTHTLPAGSSWAGTSLRHSSVDKASRLAYTHWGLASNSRTFSSSALLKGGTPVIFLFAAAWDFALTSANSFLSLHGHALVFHQLLQLLQLKRWGRGWCRLHETHPFHIKAALGHHTEGPYQSTVHQYRQCHLNCRRGPSNFDEGHRINEGGANTPWQMLRNLTLTSLLAGSFPSITEFDSTCDPRLACKLKSKKCSTTKTHACTPHTCTHAHHKQS